MATSLSHRWTFILHMIRCAHLCSKPKRHFDGFSRFCTDDSRVSLYLTMRRASPLKNCPFSWGELDAHLIHGSLGPPESSTQTAH